MLKAIIILIAVGIAVGVGGGVAQGNWWFHGGEVVVVVGIAALYAYATWKNPLGVLQAEADVTSQAEGMPPNPTTEQQLPRQPVITQVVDVPSNNTPHTDARGNVVLPQSPSARAGERER
jgi:hypothetical protein